MTTNSINTFHATKEMRETNKQKVYNCLKLENHQSRFEVGRITGLGDIEAQRRLSDLYNEGKIIITGTRKHFEHEVSLYSIYEQLQLFEIKKMRLRTWLKKNHPEILSTYEVLIEKKL